MKKPHEASMHRPPSSLVDAQLLRKLFRYAREDSYEASRNQTMLVRFCAELRHAWERYEKIR